MAKAPKSKSVKTTKLKKPDKVKNINTVDIPVQQPLLSENEFKFDPKTMEHVNVEFLDQNTVTVAIPSNSETTAYVTYNTNEKPIPYNINIEHHDELSNPEKENYTWIYWLMIPSCIFFYVLGVATAFLYHF